MQKKLVLFIILFSFKCFSQGDMTVVYSHDFNGEILCIHEDTVNQRTFVGGKFTQIDGGTNRNYIACFDANTGVLLPFNPNITSGFNLSVNTITTIGNDVYYYGDFATVAGQPRTDIACSVFTTNALKSWSPTIGGIVNVMKTDGISIYIGGNFSTVNGSPRSNVAVIDPSGVLLGSFAPNVNGGVEDLIIDNSVIYLRGFFTQINSITRMTIAKIYKSSGSLTTWNPNPTFGGGNFVKDIKLYKNKMYAVGDYTSIGGVTTTGIVSLDTINGNTINYSATSEYIWYSGCASSLPTRYHDDLAIMEDTVFFTTQIQGNGYPYELLKTNHNLSSIEHTFPTACFGPIGNYVFPNYYTSSSTQYEFPIIFSVLGNRLNTVLATQSCINCSANYTGYSGSAFWKLKQFCLRPKLPSAFTVKTSTLCAGTKNVNYSIPVTNYVSSYLWTYNGTGATITQNSNSISIDFSNSATSGTLSVQLVSDCNSAVRSLTLPITVHPLPSVNAGSDITLNCANNKVNTLNGSTSANTYTWTGPAGYYGTNLSEILNNKPQGNYVLEGTYTTTGCRWRDTAYVYVDTLQPNLTMPVITNTRLCCSNPSVNLNASSSTPGVTYNWTNNNGYSSGNPALISTTSPTIPVSNMTYSLMVTNPTNGCTNKGSIVLSLDTVHPTFGLGVNTSGAKISCISTSAVLTGTTGVSRAKLYWNGSGLALNTPNPATVTNPTTYTLMAQDTVNGCQAFVNYTVIADTAKPVVNPLPSTKYITCDTNQVTLNATSPSVNTTFTWTPPVGGNLPNPSFVSDAGTYTLNATDVNNGCTRSRYLTVIVDTLKPNLSTNVDSVKLSCSMLSYTLNTNTSSSPVTIDWAGPGGFTSPNPATVTTQGFYTTTVKNTFNGCFATKQIKVSIDSTKPYIVPFSNNFQVNCSYTTAVLSGTTIPANQYQLTWTGPAAFTSANPATVSNVGTYTFTALDTITGCKSIKEVNLNYQPVLLVDAGNDTVICNGSTAQLHVTQIGGTPTFSYSWSNGSTLANNTTTSLSDTTQFTVVVNDAVGCIGKDTVVVFVPDPIQDSSKTFLPCDPNSPLGQIQTFPYGGIPPYQFAIGSGTYQASNTFVNIPFGTHTISIKDNLGCTKTTTATIDNSSLRPEPNFLISTNMFKSDTFVVVDISNPRPDSVQWTFPPTCTIIDNSNPFSPVIVNSDTGTFVINMKAFFGTCEMNKSKLVHIGEVDTTFANGYNNNGIESITLYPNPNSGQFNVEVKLYKKQTFAIFIYNASSVEQFRQTIHESDYFNQLINIPGATSGSYVLKVVAEYDAKQKAFIISQ